MKKLLTISIVILSVYFMACGFTFSKINGNKKIAKKEFPIAEYNKVELNGAKTMIYRQSKSEEAKLTIEIDENLMQYIEVSVQGGTLKVTTTEKGKSINPSKFIIYTNSKVINNITTSGATNFTTKENIQTDDITITSSGASNINLASIDAKSIKCRTSGSSDLAVAGNTTCQNLNISASGSSDVKLNSINTTTLKCGASGSSNITLSGKANNAEFDASGSSDTKAKNMQTNDAICKASGASSISIHTSNNLEASASGSAGIKYSGNPQLQKSVSGAGSIKQIN